MLLVDLDDLRAENSVPWPLRYNRRGFLEINDVDYIDKTPTCVYEKLQAFIENTGLVINRSDRILLLTTPAVVGYVFNPAVFYFSIDKNNAMNFVAAEVHNTFGESHIYCLTQDSWNAVQRSFRSHKRFHVSPFLSRKGYYDFRFFISEDEVMVEIELHQEECMVLSTSFAGHLIPLTSSNLFKSFIRIVLTTLFTEIRILRNASNLFFTIRLPFFNKPERLYDTSESPQKGFISKIKLPFR